MEKFDICMYTSCGTKGKCSELEGAEKYDSKEIKDSDVDGADSV
jgi:hypothetical protein